VILLDTNVVSEAMRPKPDARVRAWMDEQLLETLFISAITVAELRTGVALLPAGRRQRGLAQNLEQQVLPLFAGRVLAFDLQCTPAYAELRARARASGQAIGSEDAFIAAIALEHRMPVATRDSAAFRAAGVTVVDPWAA
jgi:toxin FitB